MVAGQASIGGRGPALCGGARVVRWNPNRVQSYLSFFVALLVVMLGLFPAVDVDSDPATSNVPTAVLVAESRIPNEDNSDRLESDCGALGLRRSFRMFLRTLVESANRGRRRSRSRVSPIRGP